MSNKFFESIGGAPAYSTVAVAVKGTVGGDAVGGAASRRALRWTVENLLPNVDRLVLVHVMPTVTTIPSPCKFHLADLTQSVSSISCSHRLVLWFVTKLDRRFGWRSWRRVWCRCISEIWGRSTSRSSCRSRDSAVLVKWVSLYWFIRIFV